MQQTDAVLKSTGGVANVTARHVDQLADSISRVAGVDDEAIQAGANMLLTFKNIRNEAGAGNDIFDQTVRITADLAAGYAAASGSTINMKTASVQLGKALQDPITGLTSLRRVGVQFSEVQENVIGKLVDSGNLMQAQKVILAEVTSQFAGSAEAQATASGKVSVAFENLAETIGGLLAPAITFLAEKLQVVIAFLQDEAPAAWKAFVEAVGPVIDTIGSVLVPLFETAWRALKDKLLPALKDLMPVFKVIGAAVLVMATIILAQFALVVTAISVVIDIVGEIVKAFMKVVDWVRENLAEPIVGALQKVGDVISDVAGWIKDRFLGAWQAISGPVLAVINGIIGVVQTLVGWIQNAIDALRSLASILGPEGLQPGGFAGRGVPPQAQHGGFVTRSGLAMIHKGEAISGVNNEMGFGGINGDIVLQVNGQTLARITRDELRKLGNRNAGTGL